MVFYCSYHPALVAAWPGVGAWRRPIVLPSFASPSGWFVGLVQPFLTTFYPLG
jgi:hypothetical protein